jgi:hypothetical protein
MVLWSDKERERMEHDLDMARCKQDLLRNRKRQEACVHAANVNYQGLTPIPHWRH